MEKHEKMPSQVWFKGKSQDTLDIVDYLMANKNGVASFSKLPLESQFID